MPALSSSSSASSSDSGSDSGANVRLKRKHAEADSDSDADSRSSVKSFQTSNPEPEGLGKEDIVVGSEEEEVNVLSHKEQRRLKKKQKQLQEQEQNQEQVENESSQPKADNSKKTKGKGKEKKKDGDGPPARQNSVWVGNLSYRTTPDSLRTFFVEAGVKGEVTRVHMPMKNSSAGGGKENRGFAYVDFSTPEAKSLSITLSEKNLDGRRLLIKDGDDFSGRPQAVLPATTPNDNNNSNNNNNNAIDGEPNSLAGPSPSSTKTKSAQKILSAQKQPPCPCLFLGNLGFETTEKSIREMVEGHARALAEMWAEKERKKMMKMKTKKGRKGKDDDLMGVDGGDENDDEDEDEDKGEDEEGGEKVLVDVGIKKVRMGTFEDSGLCKGFAFVDFSSTQHATAALTNPRNHFLNGRKLVVEYASADAARRGGYREKGMIKAGGGGRGGGRKIPKRGGEDKYGDGKKRKRAENAAKNADGADNDNENGNITAGAGAGGDTEAAQRKYEYDPPKQKRPRTFDNKNARDAKRPKPGAALALAQREKVSIVPSEGTRLKFS